MNTLHVKKNKVICFVLLCKHVIFKKKGDILLSSWKANTEHKGKEAIFLLNSLDQIERN